MRHLEWTEQLDGWRSGRYRIELVAPGLWVLSRRNDSGGLLGRRPPDTILATAGSLTAAKHRAAQLAKDRMSTTRLVRRLTVFLVSVLLVSVAVGSTASWAPLASIAGASAGFIALIGVLDVFAERSFEHVRAIYQ